MVDFTSRNGVVLHTAAEDIHGAIGVHPFRVEAMERTLGDSWVVQAHWCHFSLNGRLGVVSLPGGRAGAGPGARRRRPRMKVLVVHPLGLRFAGYPYIEEKVQALAPHGVEVAVVAPFKDETTMVDGRAPSFARIPLAFETTAG